MTVSANGAISYVPTAAYVGPDSFTYKANDGALDSNTVTVSLTVTATNTAPVAVADSYSTPKNTTLTVAAPGVLGNDTDADGDTLTAILVANISHGTLGLNANGAISYVPTTGYSGPDSFTYKANDGALDSNTVTVSLTVTPTNAAPVAVADSYATPKNTTLTVAAPGVLGNDTDADGDTLSSILVANVSHGTLTLGANGSISYVPTAGYFGPDSFTYKANDGALDSNTVTVSLTVTGTNSAPVAVNDSYSTAKNTTLTVAAPGVLGNDTDADGNALTAALVANVAHGTLTLGANGSISYVPTAGYSGPDSFTYQANDGTINSNTATVSLTVTATNGAPVAVADSYSTPKNTSLVVAAPGVLANDTDPDGNPLTAAVVATVSHGTLTLAAAGGFTYAPTTGYIGADSFTYRANDGSLNSNTVTVSLTVTGPTQGYWMVASDGGIFTFGTAGFFGSKGGQPLDKPIVGMTRTPSGAGYWLVASDGGIFAFGNALFFGSKGGQPLNAPIVGMSRTPSGLGYWLVACDGGIFAFGDAPFKGSKGGQPLDKPIVGMTPTPSGQGYWLVASDGGIFSFGDATFRGSKGGQHLDKPIVGMTATASGAGYWMVASDGGIFTFGDALFYGSKGGQPLNQPIVGMTTSPSGLGYWLVASDGGIFTFGDALFYGSMGGAILDKPVVGMTSR